MNSKETPPEDFGASQCYALWRKYYEPKSEPEQLDGSRQTSQVLSNEKVMLIEPLVLGWLIQGAVLLRELAHQKSCKINDAWIREKSRSDYSHDPDYPQVANILPRPHEIAGQESGHSANEDYPVPGTY